MGGSRGKLPNCRHFRARFPQIFRSSPSEEKRQMDLWSLFKGVRKSRVRYRFDRPIVDESSFRASHTGILLHSICSLKSDSTCEPIKIVFRYWDRLSSPIKKSICLCFTNCHCMYVTQVLCMKEIGLFILRGIHFFKVTSTLLLDEEKKVILHTTTKGGTNYQYWWR